MLDLCLQRRYCVYTGDQAPHKQGDNMKKNLLLSHNGEKVFRCEGGQVGQIIAHKDKNYKLTELLPIFDGASFFRIVEVAQ
jgi:hypothetical protein